MPGDLADVEACRRVVRSAVERCGGIDVLVNNAAQHGARVHRGRAGRAVGLHHARQPARAVPLPSGGGEIDEGPRRRIDHQHRIDQRLHRRAEARALLGLERRADDADAQRRGGAGPVSDSREPDQRRVDVDRRGGAREASRRKGRKDDWLSRGSRHASLRPSADAAATSRWPPRTSRRTTARS